jgi:hypothetical protein
MMDKTAPAVTEPGRGDGMGEPSMMQRLVSAKKLQRGGLKKPRAAPWESGEQNH